MQVLEKRLLFKMERMSVGPFGEKLKVNDDDDDDDDG